MKHSYSIQMKLLLLVCVLCSYRQIPSLNAQEQLTQKTLHYEVLGIGAAVIDNVIEADDDFIEQRGGEKGGCQLVSFSALHKILEDSPTAPKRTPGGSCANTIRGLSRLGTSSAMIAPIGQDDEARMFSDKLLEYGVCPLFVEFDEPTTQLACIITPDKQRTFRTYMGASALFTGSDLEPRYFKRAKLVHMDGYSLRASNLVQQAMKLAKENNAIFSLDLGCFEIVRDNKEELEHLIKNYVDVVFANEDEAHALIGKEPQEAARILSTWCTYGIILCGEKGCWVGNQGMPFYFPTYSVSVKDTTGAGDLFASGFLHGLIQGLDLKECAALGNLLGSTVVQCCGAEITEEKWIDVLVKTSHDSSLQLDYYSPLSSK